jgi:redox-sensitive bicupin YhaK (pirin superfamily)
MTDPIDRGVEQIHVGQPATDGAGVRMTRVIATAELDHFDPFLLLDEFRSDDPGDYIAGFPDHPHRGFETVTYMLAGAMKHGDNQGNTGLLGPGSVQWMTAGRGIVHSEMPQQEDGLMWGFQLWVNLPAEQKMVEPRYQDIPASDIPETRVGDNVAVRVIAGELNGVQGPVAGIATEPFYFDVRCESKAELRLPAPEGHNVFVYPYAGEIALGRGGHPGGRQASEGTRCALRAVRHEHGGRDPPGDHGFPGRAFLDRVSALLSGGQPHARQRRHRRRRQDNLPARPQK